MSESVIARMVKLFERLPGIGPRQARRFVYSLAGEDPKFLGEFSELLIKLSKEVRYCAECFRIFEGTPVRCSICQNPSRHRSLLLIVEKDADLENIEKHGLYDGVYHVLGGLISPLRENSLERLRLRELYRRVESAKEIQEVVIGLSATTEGEHTLRYIEKVLEPLTKNRNLKISRLGRGLSTGIELEYSDRDTLRSALENRR